jgi:hypothetical protein
MKAAIRSFVVVLLSSWLAPSIVAAPAGDFDSSHELRTCTRPKLVEAWNRHASGLHLLLQSPAGGYCVRVANSCRVPGRHGWILHQRDYRVDRDEEGELRVRAAPFCGAD